MSDDVKALKLKVLGYMRERPGLVDSAQELFLELLDALEASVQAPVGCAGSCSEVIVQERAQAPAVDREALAQAFDSHERIEFDGRTVIVIGDGEEVAEALFASGILLNAAELKAEALEEAANELLPRASVAQAGVVGWLRVRAQHIREKTDISSLDPPESNFITACAQQVRVRAVDPNAMPKRWEKYLQECPANGVEHDCAYEFIEGWPLDDFERWLSEHDREVEARGLERFANIVDDWDSLMYATGASCLENVIEAARARAQQVREAD